MHLSPAVDKVPLRRLQRGMSAAITTGLSGWLKPAGFQQRFTAGLSRSHPDADVVLDLHLEVALEFLRQFMLDRKSVV